MWQDEAWFSVEVPSGREVGLRRGEDPCRMLLYVWGFLTGLKTAPQKPRFTVFSSDAVTPKPSVCLGY